MLFALFLVAGSCRKFKIGNLATIYDYVDNTKVLYRLSKAIAPRTFRCKGNAWLFRRCLYRRCLL